MCTLLSSNHKVTPPLWSLLNGISFKQAITMHAHMHKHMLFMLHGGVHVLVLTYAAPWTTPSILTGTYVWSNTLPIHTARTANNYKCTHEHNIFRQILTVPYKTLCKNKSVISVVRQWRSLQKECDHHVMVWKPWWCPPNFVVMFTDIFGDVRLVLWWPSPSCHIHHSFIFTVNDQLVKTMKS